jgi:hypothetical protein
MTTSEIQASLANHQVEQKMLAEKKTKEAGEILAYGKEYAAQHYGENMSSVRQRILDDAEAKAAMAMAEASRASLRASEAAAGRLLHGPTEWRDVAYATNVNHQRLIAGATDFGTIWSDAQDELATSHTNRRFG